MIHHHMLGIMLILLSTLLSPITALAPGVIPPMITHETITVINGAIISTPVTIGNAGILSFTNGIHCYIRAPITIIAGGTIDINGVDTMVTIESAIYIINGTLIWHDATLGLTPYTDASFHLSHNGSVNMAHARTNGIIMDDSILLRMVLHHRSNVTITASTLPVQISVHDHASVHLDSVSGGPSSASNNGGSGVQVILAITGVVMPSAITIGAVSGDATSNEKWPSPTSSIRHNDTTSSDATMGIIEWTNTPRLSILLVLDRADVTISGSAVSILLRCPAHAQRSLQPWCIRELWPFYSVKHIDLCGSRLHLESSAVNHWHVHVLGATSIGGRSHITNVNCSASCDITGATITGELSANGPDTHMVLGRESHIRASSIIAQHGATMIFERTAFQDKESERGVKRSIMAYDNSSISLLNIDIAGSIGDYYQAIDTTGTAVILETAMNGIYYDDADLSARINTSTSHINGGIRVWCHTSACNVCAQVKYLSSTQRLLATTFLTVVETEGADWMKPLAVQNFTAADDLADVELEVLRQCSQTIENGIRVEKGTLIDRLSLTSPPPSDDETSSSPSSSSTNGATPLASHHSSSSWYQSRWFLVLTAIIITAVLCRSEKAREVCIEVGQRIIDACHNLCTCCRQGTYALIPNNGQ